MSGQTFFARNGALFVQPDGPNTQPLYVSCVDVDALTEPGGGIDTIVRCFDSAADGWKTIGSMLAPPEPVTTTITSLVMVSQTFLEQIKNCPVTFFVLQSEFGRKDVFTNYVRGWIVGRAYISDRGATDLTMRESDTASSMTLSVTAEPPLYRVFKHVAADQGNAALTVAANAVAFLDDVRCATSSDSAQGICEIGFVVGETSAGVAADVFRTLNGGLTWTATSADPFGAGEAIAAVTVFAIGADTHRVIVARGTTDAGNPAEVAYSDDNGATWSLVNVGATNGQFVQAPNGLFALTQNDIWLVTNSGYIYYSEDGGVTWITQEAGVATAQHLNAVHLANTKAGFAGGDSDDVLRTIDGGASWTLVTDVGSGSNIRTLFTLDALRVWVGTENGRLYYSDDGGATWNRRTFTGDNTGQVRDIRFVNDLIGYMLHNTETPAGRVFVTIDGGYTWELMATTTNAGLNSLSICDENTIYAAGEIVSGSTVIVTT